MDQNDDHQELLDALIERLRTEGAPAGTWLVDITAARRDLRRVSRRVADLGDELEDALDEVRRVIATHDLFLERLQKTLVREPARATSYATEPETTSREADDG